MDDIINNLRKFVVERSDFSRPDELRRHLEILVKSCFSNDPHARYVGDLLTYLFANEETIINTDTLEPKERIYAESILETRKHIQQREYIVNSSTDISTVPRLFDSMVNSVVDWSIFKAVNFALMLSIPARRRTAIVTSIRNEGTSILEWIAHHQSLGFERIFVYTNDNTDGSSLLLETLANHKVIRLMNNEVGPNIPPQIKAYEHSIHFLPELREFEWVFYLDADEFFIPIRDGHCHIDDLFSELSDKLGSTEPAAIEFNWKWFGSENAYNRTEGMLLKRFMYSIPNEHVKSLVNLKYVLSMKHLHSPVLFKDCFAVDSQLERLPGATAKISPVYGAGQINHYWNKSFEEFVIKKFRGRGAVGSTGEQRDFSSFFDWGANDRRGEYDPPPTLVIERTAAAYADLLKLSDVRNSLESIDKIFAQTIHDIDRNLNLKRIYEKRGRS